MFPLSTEPERRFFSIGVVTRIPRAALFAVEGAHLYTAQLLGKVWYIGNGRWEDFCHSAFTVALQLGPMADKEGGLMFFLTLN